MTLSSPLLLPEVVPAHAVTSMLDGSAKGYADSGRSANEIVSTSNAYPVTIADGLVFTDDGPQPENYLPGAFLTGCFSYGCVEPMFNWNQFTYEDLYGVAFANQQINSTQASTGHNLGEWNGYGVLTLWQLYNQSRNPYYLAAINSSTNTLLDYRYMSSSSIYNGLFTDSKDVKGTHLMADAIAMEGAVIDHWLHPSNLTVGAAITLGANALANVIKYCNIRYGVSGGRGAASSHALCRLFNDVPPVSVQNYEVETPQEVVSRVKKITNHIEPERIWLNPDCGFAPGIFRTFPREVAFAKLRSMTSAAELLREEYA